MSTPSRFLPEEIKIEAKVGTPRSALRCPVSEVQHPWLRVTCCPALVWTDLSLRGDRARTEAGFEVKGCSSEGDLLGDQRLAPDPVKAPCVDDDARWCGTLELPPPRGTCRRNPKRARCATRFIEGPERVPATHERLAVVEVTGRTQGGHYLLCPSLDLNEEIAGIVGRAQALTGTRIYACHVLSNHLALVLGVRDCNQLADFTHRVFGQISVRVRKLRGLNMKVWARRNRSIPVMATREDACKVLKYNLANGAKEHAVAHPADWPGLHSAKFFCKGEALRGYWTDHSAFAAARKRDPDARLEDFRIEYEIVHSKLPWLEALSDAAYCALLRGWCDEVATEAAAIRRADKLPEPGDPERLCHIPYDHRPEEAPDTTAPLVHAIELADRRRYRAAYVAYIEAHRAARAALRARLASVGVDLSAGLDPTGWVGIDPSMVTPPVAVGAEEAAPPA